ncbi:hypothetical protein NMG60_11015130 [Bertholletia excelsa]
MGIKFNHSLHLFIFLLLFLVLLDSFSQVLPSSSNQVQIVAFAPSIVHSGYQDLSIKSTTPLYLNKQHGKKKKKKNMKRRKMKSFLVMLPKGYIPPLGSSPYHNGDPHSFTFYCDLSTPKT